nr:probable GTP diphosphokinase RSH2, chloroplastic [Tanacetum cinerariifolium]
MRASGDPYLLHCVETAAQVVMGEGLVPFEVQIRTKEIRHSHAEFLDLLLTGDTRKVIACIHPLWVEWARWVVTWQSETMMKDQSSINYTDVMKPPCKSPFHSEDCPHSYEPSCLSDGPVFVIVIENDKVSNFGSSVSVCLVFRPFSTWKVQRLHKSAPVVMGEGLVPLEVQSRTKEMRHSQAEFLDLLLTGDTRKVFETNTYSVEKTRRDLKFTLVREWVMMTPTKYIGNLKDVMQEFPANATVKDILDRAGGWSPYEFSVKQELTAKLNHEAVSDPIGKMRIADVVELAPKKPDKSLIEKREEIQQRCKELLRYYIAPILIVTVD